MLKAGSLHLVGWCFLLGAFFIAERIDLVDAKNLGLVPVLMLIWSAVVILLTILKTNAKHSNKRRRKDTLDRSSSAAPERLSKRGK